MALVCYDSLCGIGLWQSELGPCFKYKSQLSPFLAITTAPECCQVVLQMLLLVCNEDFAD